MTTCTYQNNDPAIIAPLSDLDQSLLHPFLQLHSGPKTRDCLFPPRLVLRVQSSSLGLFCFCFSHFSERLFGR